MLVIIPAATACLHGTPPPPQQAQRAYRCRMRMPCCRMWISPSYISPLPWVGSWSRIRLPQAAQRTVKPHRAGSPGPRTMHTAPACVDPSMLCHLHHQAASLDGGRIFAVTTRKGMCHCSKVTHVVSPARSTSKIRARCWQCPATSWHILGSWKHRTPPSLQGYRCSGMTSAPQLLLCLSKSRHSFFGDWAYRLPGVTE